MESFNHARKCHFVDPLRWVKRSFIPILTHKCKKRKKSCWIGKCQCDINALHQHESEMLQIENKKICREIV
ncbi:CLUMA_CG001360, isoform A [Clunio marinus]|uniref:CLUMA_CG001360, isoform A n=1 Tax=Clunio marinus TaxID=568069 RepID=A0A1J1HI37_9DIPT|nr:CLUMA_CG001360, isoform A [Clunio marinus]